MCSSAPFWLLIFCKRKNGFFVFDVGDNSGLPLGEARFGRLALVLRCAACSTAGDAAAVAVAAV